MAGYILKIMLENTHPPVWRRIMIPEKITFEELHEMIQILFGWENDHLHDFRIPSKYICIDSEEKSWDRYHYMEDKTPVDRILTENKWVRYTYDFGDDWRHKIVYEKTDETYDERYATLVKFKGDNFLEDSGGVWEDCRNAFDPAAVGEKLKRLVCPICKHQEKPTDDMELTSFEDLAKCYLKKLIEKMAETGKMPSVKESPSKMAIKIDAWKEFAENWVEKGEEQTAREYQQMTLPFVEVEAPVENTGDSWEIVVSGICNEKQKGKTNRELLQDLSYQEAKDYCKYLQIPVLDTWTKQQMTDAVADMFAKHPEYLLYVFFKDEYTEFVKLMQLSCGEIHEKPSDVNVWIKGFALGLADVSVIHGKKGNRAEISFASDVKRLLAVSAKERNTVYRRLKTFSDNMRSLVWFYGIAELEALHKIYCQSYHVTIEQSEFNRYIYWYGRFNNRLLTATAEDGTSYVASPDLDLEIVKQKTEKFAGDLDYIICPAAELRKISGDISERSEWVDVLFTCLYYAMKVPAEMASEILEEIFCCVMNGDTLPEVISVLYEMAEEVCEEISIALRCEIWGCISGLMLELELPMLKGRSRNNYGEEKTVSPWTIDMCEAACGNVLANSKTKQMQEFPVEIQEMMYNATCFADTKAMDVLWKYHKKEKVKSEEFLYLLADAYITGGEFERASDVLRELERSSKRAEKAAAVLRIRLEQGADVMDEPWESADDFWDFEEEPFQMPYVRGERKIGRNEPCPCGSGKKYKHCCGK